MKATQTVVQMEHARECVSAQRRTKIADEEFSKK
jgi:hypothetical protein